MKSIRIIVLGKENAGDDAAAIQAVQDLNTNHNVIVAGRPGLDLIQFLETSEPVVLVDVMKGNMLPGTILNMSIKELQDSALADVSYSNHDFGPAETLKLMKSLNKDLPTGFFVGIEGRQFRLGKGLSGMVADKLPELQDHICKAVTQLSDPATIS